jgi:Asp/Glu/hydantoin racemase
VAPRRRDCRAAEHVESVTLPLRRLVESDNASDAFIIACYSDPGLHVCREGTARPVFGIGRCSWRDNVAANAVPPLASGERSRA